MKPRNDPRTELRRAFRVSGFAGLTGSLLTAYRFHDRLAAPESRDALRERYVHAWTEGMLRLFNVKLLPVSGSPKSRAEHPGGRMVVSNHRSTIDIGVMLHEFGGHVVSRDDLARWPLVGAAARSVGTIFVDRESASSGVNAIRTMSRMLKLGRTISVFPEGTTFSGDEVHPFHKGAFVAAKMADAPIVPVGLAYGSESGASFVNETFLAHLSRVARTKVTRVAYAVGEPMAPAKNAERAAEAARIRVQQLVEIARRAVDAS